MSKMIKLDWLAMKFYQLRILFILPPYVIGVGMFVPEWIIPLIGFMMVSYSVNPFAVEDKGRLNHLYLTLPVTRKKIVRARFGLSLIMEISGIAVGAVCTAAASALLNGRITLTFSHTFEVSFINILMLVCLTLLIYSVINLCTFPLLFKLGYAKGKALGYYVPVFGFIILIAFVYLNVLTSFLTTAGEWLIDRLYFILEWSFYLVN